MIKAICFDLDGVYFTHESFQNFKKELVNLGAAKEKVDYYLHEDPMQEFKKGLIDEKSFWRKASKYWGINLSLDEVKQLLAKSYSRDEGVVNIVRKVRLAGYKTCIASNNFPTRINTLQEKFGFLDDFDVSVFSYDVGATKPDTKIYQTLIKRLNVKPNEVVISDDQSKNIKSAADLGINSFLFTNFNDFIKKLRSLGVTVNN